MRYTLLVIIIACLFSVQLDAQKDNGKKGNRKAKMESLRIAYLTEQLDLTKEEWQAFWPIYNKYSDMKQQKRMDRRGKRENGALEKAGESLDEMIAREEQELAMKKAYIKELRSVVSDETVLLYFKAERKFKERLLKRYKGERKGAEKMQGKKKEKGI